MARSRPLRVLLIAAFVTFFDRALLPPLVLVIAREFDVPVDSTARAFSAYVLAYAGMQLVWAVISSRFGRIRTLTAGLLLGAVGVLIAGVAQSSGALVVGRVIAGAGFGAVVPLVLTYIGDEVAWNQRGRIAANLAAALSLGMTIGTLAAALLGEWRLWRLGFACVGVITVIVIVLLRRLPQSTQAVEAPRLWPGLGRVARNPWAIAVLILTAAEGALLIGVFGYFPVALQQLGYSVSVAGLVTCLFGVAVIGASQLVKVVVSRWSPWLLLLLGGMAAIGGFAVVAWRITPGTIATATLCLGISWAVMHTQMQIWMTDVVHDSRPIGMALFATALFGGGSAGALWGASTAPTGHFAGLFAVSSAVAVLLTAGVSVGRARYRVSEK